MHAIESYFPLRRDTIGVYPSIEMLAVHFTSPTVWFNIQTVQRLAVICTDLIAMGDDVYSHDKEQACGDEGHNLVTVVMHELGLDAQGAFDWIGTCSDGLAEEFLGLYGDLPGFEDESEAVNRELRKYVDGIGNWVRGNDQWGFEVH